MRTSTSQLTQWPPHALVFKDFPQSIFYRWILEGSPLKWTFFRGLTEQTEERFLGGRSTVSAVSCCTPVGAALPYVGRKGGEGRDNESLRQCRGHPANLIIRRQWWSHKAKYSLDCRYLRFPLWTGLNLLNTISTNALPLVGPGTAGLSAHALRKGKKKKKEVGRLHRQSCDFLLPSADISITLWVTIVWVRTSSEQHRTLGYAWLENRYEAFYELFAGMVIWHFLSRRLKVIFTGGWGLGQ